MPRLVDISASADLVALACLGDERARSQLYASLAPAAFGLIRRLVGHRAQAEDIFQDTMMAFFDRLETHRAEAPIGAWLRQIAVSKCLMYLRSPWHRARRELGWLEDETPAPAGPSPEAMDVERALDSLTPTARSVVWLYEVEGYSHEEIAREFGRSVSFSKSQVARAHSRLRAWFDVEAEKLSCNTAP